VKGPVLIVSAEYPPMHGGIGDYTARLVAALADNGWHARVLTSEGARSEDPRVLAQVHRWNWDITDQVRAAIQSTQAELLHIQYQTGAYGMHPAINFLPRRLGKGIDGPAVVTTFHDLLPPYLFPKAGPARDWVTRSLARGSDAIIVTNVQDLESLALQPRLIRRLMMIPIGSNLPDIPPIERDSVRKRLDLPEERPLAIGFFGFLAADKGVDILLKAVADLPFASTAALVIIGGGLSQTDVANRDYHDWITQQFRECRVPVVQTGHLSPNEAAAALRAMDLVVLPFRDGASLRRGTLIAAIRAGATVLTTDPGTDGSLDPLIGGESLWLVSTGDPDALRVGMETLLGDQSLRDRIGANAQAQGPNFDWDVIAKQHITLYENLLARSGEPATPD
jgi:glycosyltransferase involved in cell wall biosynthesis